jgi:hypothetical protein
MKCPHCDAELPSRECPECHESVLIDGKFCHHCGAELTLQDSTQSEDVDFSERILCSDGTCIGVINKEGICNECGKPYMGEPE